MFGLTSRRVSPRDTIMFDIDETLVTRRGRRIEPMVSMLINLKNRGYKILLMTARPNNTEAKAFTVDQLELLQIPYDYLMFVPAHKKTAVKSRLNLNIILSVGDKVTDLGASPYFIKLAGSEDPSHGTNLV